MEKLIKNSLPEETIQYIHRLLALKLHSIVIYKNGDLLTECYVQPYAKGKKQILFSVSKSFTAVAMMFALQDNLFTLDTKIYDILKKKLSFNPQEDVKEITIHHLLSMTYGFVDKEIQEFYLADDWIAEAFSLKLQDKPGTKFFYNNRCPFLCSVIIQELTGKSLLAYLDEKLFKYLNISNVSWEKNQQGYDKGSWGLSLTTRDLAKFGQFILNKGTWDNQELLKSKYVDKLLTVYINTDNNEFADNKLGYGYYFWKCQIEGAFHAAGLFGQYCIVLPKQQMVIAITSNSENEQKQDILSTTWDFVRILEKYENSVLKLNKEQDKLADISKYFADVHIPYLSNDNIVVDEIFNCKFKFLKNDLNMDSVFIRKLDEDTLEFILKFVDKDYTVVAKLNSWQENQTNTNNELNDDFDSCTTLFYENPYANYGWQNKQLILKLLYNQGVFIDELSFRYYNDKLYVEYIPSPTFVVRTTKKYLVANLVKNK